MSFKNDITNVADCEHVLSSGVKIPVKVFMNDKLLMDSEELLWQEVVNIANFPGVTNIVVTPDAHASGNGIPVGVVAETDGSIVIPCAAGYDINCGMAAIKTHLNGENIHKDKELIRNWINLVMSNVSVGLGGKGKISTPDVFEDIISQGALSNKKFHRYQNQLERINLPVDMGTIDIPQKAMRGMNQIGTLGGGNHFIELDVDEKNTVWALVHTGSRGFGHGIASYFFRAGAEEFKKKNIPLHNMEQVYFDMDSDLGKSYLNHMNAAANFAIVNRLTICLHVMEAINDVWDTEATILYDISHNLVQSENGKLIHRKGATRALPGDHPLLKGTIWDESGHPILIPGSMGTSSAILFAKDSNKSLYSINHGCGRVMGRKAAKRDLASMQKDIDQDMNNKNILINTWNTPLDECSLVYKNIDDVLSSVSGANLAEVAHTLTPKAVIKGND